MKRETLYAALSTTAQCAAALAALIGFLSLWRLDRHKQHQEQVERDLRGLLVQIEVPRAALLPLNEVLRQAQQYARGDAPLNHRYEELRPELQQEVAQLKALERQQWSLLRVLPMFLVMTLVILAAAVLGLLYVDQAATWRWTPWLLWIAAGWLVGGPTWMVVTATLLHRATDLLGLD